MVNAIKIWHDLARRAKVREPLFLTERVEAYEKRSVNPISGGHFIQGRRPKANDIQLVSNDYLSISDHPDVKKAQTDVIQEQGHGLLRSGVFTTGETLQRRFERGVAEWISDEDALLCQSGWCANIGLIQSIATPEVPVYLDMMAHMSLWEGVKSAGAKPHPFRHNSPESLENLIKKHGQGVVLVDALYSTSGSICPLEEIADISSRYDCILVVDESHSLGIIGEKGEGLVSKLGLTDKVHFRTTSLSKAFAGRGGVIVGSARHIEYIRYESFPAIFSSSVLEYEVAGFLAALEVIKAENFRREEMRNNADYLRSHLNRLGYNVKESQSQIISLVPGPEHRTIVLRNALEERGIFASPFCSPATPLNGSLMRFSVNASLTNSQLQKVVDVCREIREIVQMDQWQSTAKKNRRRSRTRDPLPELSLAF